MQIAKEIVLFMLQLANKSDRINFTTVEVNWQLRCIFILDNDEVNRENRSGE